MSDDISSSGLPQPVPNSSNATLSLVMGILGVTILPLLGSIIALVTGYNARKEIRAVQASGGSLGGEGMATTGIVLGWIGIALMVIGMCVACVFLLIPLALVPLGIYWGNSALLLPLL
jgi:hypothetical protein